MKKSYELKSFSIRLAFSLLLSLTAFISFSGFEPSDVVYDKCKDQEMYHADCSRFIAKEAGQAKNVILLIGDGMGIPQTWLVRTYLNGPAKHLVWEDLPNQGLMTTCSIGHITDSAASGTALATGYKTTNGRISISASGSETLPNILDRIHDRKAVGVVSTGSMVDATPAVFVSHVTLRSMDRKIAGQMVNESMPEVILGGGSESFEPNKKSIIPTKLDRKDFIQAARDNGYTIVRTDSELASLDLSSTRKLLGLFADDEMTYESERSPASKEPHLSDMAAAALEVLANDPQGFFVMIEGARIDHACHAADMDKLLGEMVEFNKTTKMVVEWTENHPGTLLIITADHETGGIEIPEGEHKRGERINVKWTTMIMPLIVTHSSQRVPVYAIGPNGGAVKDHMDNTEIFCLIMNAFGETADTLTETLSDD